tara:strand:- start:655 stop:2562 length:1908 start_codon:yes stop_codon:yes gene_type:complete
VGINNTCSTVANFIVKASQNGIHAEKIENAAGQSIQETYVDGSGNSALSLRNASGFQRVQLSTYEDSYISAGYNFGLGTSSLNAYNSAHSALELGTRGANIAGRTDSDTIYVNANSYQHTDGNWKYDSTDEASQYYQTGGTHNWRRAASGTAGTNITWTTQAVLDSTGLGLGTTSSPSALIHAEAADGAAGGAIKYTATGVASGYLSASPDGTVLATDTAGISFRTGITGNDPTDTGTEVLNINSSGVAFFYGGEASFGTDTNNRGIVNYGSNVLALSTVQSGTTYYDTVKITDGKVGVNISPLVDFHVNNASTNGVARISTSHSTSYAQLQLVNQSGNYWYQTITHGDNAYRLYNGSDRLTVLSDGKTGVGTSAPRAQFESRLNAFAARDNLQTSNFDTTSGTDQMAGVAFGLARNSGTLFDTAGIIRTGRENDWTGVDAYINSFMAFYTIREMSVTEKMRLSSEGNLMVGQQFALARLTVQAAAGNNVTCFRSAGAQANTRFIRFDINANTEVGSITYTAGGATAYNTSSDYRIKENVVGITDGITRIKLLKPSRFNFIKNADQTVDGFVAHEVSDIVPEAITGEKDAVDKNGDPEYQGIDQSKLVPLLTAALQEAIKKIETLETKVAALEAA